jgi:hypothetical protein
MRLVSDIDEILDSLVNGAHIQPNLFIEANVAQFLREKKCQVTVRWNIDDREFDWLPFSWLPRWSFLFLYDFVLCLSLFNLWFFNNLWHELRVIEQKIYLEIILTNASIVVGEYDFKSLRTVHGLIDAGDVERKQIVLDVV